MKKIVKQILGIDVAQKELVVCFGKMYNDWTPELIANKTFSNTAKGFLLLTNWVNKLKDSAMKVHYVMEATGVYHEQLAYYLSDRGDFLSIVLPNKISNYARTLAVKTITDKTASEAITLFGLERNLEYWNKPKKMFKNLRQLTRERSQLIEERTMLKNQLHAEKSGAEPLANSIQRINKRIVLLNKQEVEIQQEIKALVTSDEQVHKTAQFICSIPGVGLLTAATILGETNGFDLIRNKRQLSSYAGLDVKEKQSGTSVKGKPKISKKGNKHLRKCLHLPALSAIRNDDRYKNVFARLVSKHGIKMKAAVAIQRKILEMSYILYKTQVPYNKLYFENIN